MSRHQRFFCTVGLWVGFHVVPKKGKQEVSLGNDKYGDQERGSYFGGFHNKLRLLLHCGQRGSTSLPNRHMEVMKWLAQYCNVAYVLFLSLPCQGLWVPSAPYCYHIHGVIPVYRNSPSKQALRIKSWLNFQCGSPKLSDSFPLAAFCMVLCYLGLRQKTKFMFRFGFPFALKYL